MFYPWKSKKLSWMTGLLALLLINIGSVNAASLTATSLTATKPPVILVMGDSLSAAYNIPTQTGWVALLEQRLLKQHLKNEQSWQLVNASISGETTSGGLTRLPALLRQHQPSIVLLELGANDGLRGLPPSLINNNLEKMLALSQQSGAKVMLLGILLPPNYGPAYLAKFENIYPKLAQQHQLPLVPFLLEGVADKPELMQEDRLHPTAQAQPLILETVWLELEALLN
ncbi:MAG TPA: arylesterase [Marinospirillum sp.]|uniref:arylesterase n=1 Tax=Marinospirillum sp. TaxID=2183934 RepID=UPI002B483307|nr:arylesterase [Marinospirillum sp.]HKM14826.1 arylesterase [Marinospirillum sp.]